MIDMDICLPSRFDEEFLQSLRTKLKKDCEPTKIYISTANPCNSFYAKFFNNTKLTEELE